MSETTTVTGPRSPGVTGGLAIHLAFYALMWAGIAVAILIVNLTANSLWGEVDGSRWEGLAMLVQYVMIVAGVMVVTGYLPVYVAHGITRRAFISGAFVAVIAVALAAALAATLLFAIESVVFDIAGWPHVLSGERDRHVFDRPDEYGRILLEHGALYVSHIVSGLVVGAALLRLGWGYGSVLIVGGLAIAVGAEIALRSGFAGVALADWLDLGRPPAAVGVAIALGLSVAGAAAARSIMASMPIDVSAAGWWR